MAILTALLILSISPESGALAQARATAHIVSAERVDFGRPRYRTPGDFDRQRLVSLRPAPQNRDAASPAVERLVEFQ